MSFHDLDKIAAVLKGHSRFLGSSTTAMLALDIGRALGLEGDLFDEFLRNCQHQNREV